jgi:hypothetical protein
MKRETRAIHKALMEIKANRLEYKAAFILYQVNGYDSAMAFIRKLEQNRDTESIPAPEDNPQLRTA